MPSRPGQSWLGLLLAALPLMTGCAGNAPAATAPADFVALDDDGFHGAALTTPYVVLDRPLLDTEGDPYSLVSDTDKPLTLVFFGYTNCPDICPVVMSSMSAGLARLSDEQRGQVDVVLVTTDPARDDEQVLRRWLDHFDPTFIGLTGPLSDIVDLAGPLKIYIEKGKKLPSGGYEVGHGTPVLGIDDQDQVSIVWTEGTSPSQFAEDIVALLASARG